jgi:hypothetical protein
MLHPIDHFSVTQDHGSDLTAIKFISDDQLGQTW